MRTTRRGLLAGGLLLAGALVAGCGSNDGATSAEGTTTTAAGASTTAAATTTPALGGAGQKVTVGSFGFSESETLAQIYGGALKKQGFEVSYKLKLGNREVVAPALEKGDIDLVPEYLGNYLGFLDKTATNGIPVGEATTKLQTAANARGVTALEVSPATDGDVIAVTKDFASKNSLTTISDLAKLNKTLKLAGPSECEKRQTCKLGLESVYGLKIQFVSTGADAGGPLTKKALDDGTADIARLFSSDVQVGEKYVVLKDDKSFQQAGNIVPVVRTTKVTPALTTTLNKVSAALTDEKLIALNKKTDVDKDDPSKVAAGFLAEAGLG